MKTSRLLSFLCGCSGLLAVVSASGCCGGARRADLELTRAELRASIAREAALEKALRASLATPDSTGHELSGADPGPLVVDAAAAEGDGLLADVIERASQKVEPVTFESGFEARPDVEVRLRRSLGRSLLAQGDRVRGLEQLARAAEICRETLGEQHPLTIATTAEWQEARRVTGE